MELLWCANRNASETVNGVNGPRSIEELLSITIKNNVYSFFLSFFNLFNAIFLVMHCIRN